MSTVNASPTIDYESFLLRLRRTNGPQAGECRIHLHDIRDDEECYFNSLRELTAYLQMQANGARVEGPPPFATGEG